MKKDGKWMEIYKRYFKTYRFSFIIAVACVFLEAVCDLLQPTIMAQIIDEGVKNGQIQTVLQFGLIMLSVTALGACFATVRNILASTVSQGFGADLRADVFAKIIHFSEVSVDKMESGSLITRMTNDISQITHFINGSMRMFFKAPVTCIGSIVFAVLLSRQMSIILFLAVVVVAACIFISMTLSYRRFAKVQAAIDRVNRVVQEYLMGIRRVKAFGRYDDEEDKFEQANGDLANNSVSSQRVIATFSPLMSLAVNLGIAGILYLGSILFAQGRIEVGKVAAFINYMAQILSSLIMMTNVFNTFVRTKASSERIQEVLTCEEDFKGSGPTVQDPSGELVFEDVTFAYPNGSGLPALQNLSFSINRGETVAVIGPTGAGKSTLAWLCLRFYDLAQGTIYYNGQDIRTMDVQTLRVNIALAPQQSMLFSGTIAENIQWGKAAASREEMIEAVQVAQAEEFIEQIPGNYEGRLGQGGVNLSGGQRQRISMARALVKKAPILILDDCTSALDAVTEARVRSGLRTREAGKTIVMITQRIGTALEADKILVLDNGVRVGFGCHDELLQTCPTYREIYDSQIGGDIRAGEADG